jgi:tetratricopeptide (TPR) repeat protein|tara:strand:- start:330 stop:1214 length:885 start_codon:yes stop_codon:yes gene_type:complete
MESNLSIEMLEDGSREAALRGKHTVAVDLQARAVVCVRKLFGLSSQRIRNCCTKFVVLCNSCAMRLLGRKAFDLAEELLVRASDMTVRNGPLQRHADARIKLRAATMSNFGCYWKSRREYGRALTCLKKAAALEERALATSVDIDSPATTHLNLCSVLSALGRHAQARDHARVALQILELEMDRAIAGGGDIAVAEERSSKLRITALYNKAVEEMWLFQYVRAEQTYIEALDEATENEENNGGGDHTGMATLRNSIKEGLKEAREKIQSKKDEKERMKKQKDEKMRHMYRKNRN